MIGWAFHAIGTPAPQGSKVPKGRTKTGRIVLVESSAAVKPWRDTVTNAAFGAGPKLAGPVALHMIFTVARPKGARKTEIVPWKAPDLSKYARATEDAITSAGLWHDDGQVADYHRLAKVWSGFDPEALPVPGVIVAAVEIDTTASADHALEDLVDAVLAEVKGGRP